MNSTEMTHRYLFFFASACLLLGQSACKKAAPMPADGTYGSDAGYVIISKGCCIEAVIRKGWATSIDDDPVTWTYSSDIVTKGEFPGLSFSFTGGGDERPNWIINALFDNPESFVADILLTNVDWSFLQQDVIFTLNKE